MTFKVGDVVRLNSGGPEMTVSHADADPITDGKVWLAWFNGSSICNTAFWPSCLTLVKSVKPEDDEGVT